MKSGIIENDDGWFVQNRKKMIGQPLIEPIGVGGTFKQNRSDKFFAAFGGDQAGARAFVA